MAKRIVIKIGNVFCVEIDGSYKCYFQYVCNDRSMLNSDVIRVFKTRYPMDYEPVVKDIVRDEVAFHAHTIIRAGIFHEAWYKVGPSAIISDAHEKVLWGITKSVDMDKDGNVMDVDPMRHWSIWHIDNEKYEIGEIPNDYNIQIEPGGVFPYVEILTRIRLGYYKYSSSEYNVIKRIPHADVDSYVKKSFQDKEVYYHFKGENVVQEIKVVDNSEISVSEGNPLDRPKFWETNWKYEEFITEEEFREAWSKYNSAGE